jgi:hypothetical protein
MGTLVTVLSSALVTDPVSPLAADPAPLTAPVTSPVRA